MESRRYKRRYGIDEYGYAYFPKKVSGKRLWVICDIMWDEPVNNPYCYMDNKCWKTYRKYQRRE